jgi:hypothetical protein
MTTTFSFSRLLQLIRKQWIENARLYLFSVLALLGLLALILTFWVTTSGPYYREDVTFIIFIAGLFISGSVFAGFSFNMLSDKAKGTYWLGFPASHIEKLMCMVFYSLIVYTLVYCACFFLLKWLAVAYIRQLVAREPGTYSFHEIDWSDPNGFMQVFRILMYGYVAIQSFYLLGSAYFSRYAFVLTTVAGAAIVFLFVMLMISLATNAFPDGFSWNGYYVRDFKSQRDYELSPWLTDVIAFSAKFIWAPVFWVAAWFRLKEKQI